jgi:hypothetical protein
MRNLVILAAAAFAAAIAAAAAQEDAAETGPHPDGAPDAVPPASELDALSGGAADAFADFDKAQVRKPVSVTVRALDKITARTNDLEIDIGESAKFGSIEVLARSCDKRPPEEFPETAAFLEIFDRDLDRARAAASVEVRDAGAARVERNGRVVLPVAKPAAQADNVDLPSALDPDRVFSGWMFASTPALNALEHPVYDVWVIDCKTVVVDN